MCHINLRPPYRCFDILELFRRKASLLGEIDGFLFMKLASVVIAMNKPPVLKWLLQVPEVVSFMDEGEEVKRGRRFFTFGLLEYARKHNRVEMCELLTEFMGESLSGDDDRMSLKDCITEVKGESQGGLDGDEERMSLKDCIAEVKGESQGGLDGDEEGMSLKDCITEGKGVSQGGLDGDEDGMSIKDCMPASVNPNEDNSMATESTDDVAVKIKYCWN